MFNFSLPELFIIFVVALVVLGPEKLPEIGRALGRGLAQLQRSLQGVREQMYDGTDQNQDAGAGPEKAHTFESSETLHTRDSSQGGQGDASDKEHH